MEKYPATDHLCNKRSSRSRSTGNSPVPSVLATTPDSTSSRATTTGSDEAAKQSATISPDSETSVSPFFSESTTPCRLVDRTSIKKRTSRHGADSKKLSLSTEETKLVAWNEHNHDNATASPPGAFSVFPTTAARSSMESSNEVENRFESVGSGLDRAPSLVIAAQLVTLNHEDEPVEDLELKIEEEVESRLTRRDQTLVVAEVMPPVTCRQTCKQWCWKWKYLLSFGLLFVIGLAVLLSSIDNISSANLNQFVTEYSDNFDAEKQRIIQKLETYVNTTQFDDPDSPQSSALDSALLSLPYGEQDSIPVNVILERYAFFVLYYSTEGWIWRNSLCNDCVGKDVCEWNSGSQRLLERTDQDAKNITETYGVYCDEALQVQQIRLANIGLVGTIPSELSLLSNLRVLGLENNKLEAFIPTELGRLTALQKLYLHGNFLDGTVPTELGQLTDIADLQLYDNNLNGPLPTEIGNLAALELLDLHSNRFTGTLPTEVGRCTVMERFHMYQNFVTGSLPTELGLMTALTSFRVDSNDFTGTLPTEFGQLTGLQQLYVDGNGLNGTIPTELSNNQNLDIRLSNRL